MKRGEVVGEGREGRREGEGRKSEKEWKDDDDTDTINVRQGRDTQPHLGLHCSEVGLDSIGFTDQHRVLLLVLRDTLLQFQDDLGHLLSLHLRVVRLPLQCAQLSTQRINSQQHVGIAQLEREERTLN